MFSALNDKYSKKITVAGINSPFGKKTKLFSRMKYEALILYDKDQKCAQLAQLT